MSIPLKKTTSGFIWFYLFVNLKTSSKSSLRCQKPPQQQRLPGECLSSSRRNRSSNGSGLKTPGGKASLPLKEGASFGLWCVIVLLCKKITSLRNNTTWRFFNSPRLPLELVVSFASREHIKPKCIQMWLTFKASGTGTLLFHSTPLLKKSSSTRLFLQGSLGQRTPDALAPSNWAKSHRAGDLTHGARC